MQTSVKDNTPKQLDWLLLVYIALFIVLACSCSETEEPEPMTDCYEIAKALEKEQFEAYQNYASISEIKAIRIKYQELYPYCRWD